MRFFLIWFLLSLMVAVIAGAKRRSARAFFAISMLLSPLVGFIAILFSPAINKNERGSHGSIRCDYCHNPVDYMNKVCSFCGRPLPEIIDAEVVSNAGPADKAEAKTPQP